MVLTGLIENSFKLCECGRYTMRWKGEMGMEWSRCV